MSMGVLSLKLSYYAILTPLLGAAWTIKSLHGEMT